MSLQFIIGSSGIGKTHYACQRIIQESLENPGKLYYIIVPEQFTMQTQKNVVEMHPGKGILNIDVLSFQRLAYRVFEEVGGAREVLLDDTGKSYGTCRSWCSSTKKSSLSGKPDEQTWLSGRGEIPDFRVHAV